MQRSKKLLAGVTALAIVGVVGSVAQAHNLGGKWGQKSYMYHNNMNGHTWYEANVMDPSASRWTSQTIFGLSKSSPLNSAVAHVVYSANDGLYGYGEPGPNPFGGTYTYGTVKVNDYNVGPHDNQRQKNCVAAHEMGHVIGLAHNENTTYNSIMYRYHDKRCHTWDLLGPQPHDETDVSQLY